MPVLGHYCLFSRSGNLPFLKPNLIERYANGASWWCGPLGSSGALAAPRRSPQADICLRLSMIASSEEVANRLIAMAQDYSGRADEIEADSTMAMPTMTAPSASPDRETNQT